MCEVSEPEEGSGRQFWMSSSSESPVGGGGAAVILDVLAHDECSEETAKNKLLACGVMCESVAGGRSCRKQFKKHLRGTVCKDHMEPSSFVQCANGCEAYVHVGCQGSSDGPWKCSKCRASDERISAATPSANQLPVPVAAEEEPIITFEDFDQCKKNLKRRNFNIETHHVTKQGVMNRVYFGCRKCSVNFTARLCASSLKWLVPQNVDHKVCSTACGCTPIAILLMYFH
jgi:hypothetical protein